MTYTWTIRRCAPVFIVMPNLVEVVFVELSHKTRKVAVLEMLWKDVFRKLLVLLWCQRVVFQLRSAKSYLKNHKAVAFISPSYNAFILRTFEHPAKIRSIAVLCSVYTLSAYLYSLRTCGMVSMAFH